MVEVRREGLGNGGQLERGPHSRPDFQPEEQTIAPIILLSIGGMLAFFSIGFGIVWWVADSFFIWPALVLLSIGGTMMMIGYRMVRQNARPRRQKQIDDIA